MTVKITLEYGSVEEAIVALGRLAQVAKVRRAAAATPQPDAPVALAPMPTAASEAPAAATEKKARGRPRKEKAAAPATSPDLTSVESPQAAPAEADKAQPSGEVPPVAAAPVPTEAEAKAALEAYFEKNGPQKAMAKLASFGVSRLRDLPEGQRAEFIKACAE